MSGTGSVRQPEDQKPAMAGQSQSQSQSNHINLKVKSQEGTEVFFRVKHNTQLHKLMTAYSNRQSMDSNSIAFLFDGRRICPEETPEQLGMEDGDEVDAMLHQTGGGFEE